MSFQSNIAFVGRVAVQSAQHPSTVLTLSWLAQPRLDNWQAGEPWWTARAISYLAKNLKPGDRVWEWGSGGSTVWLSERGSVVTSVEHNPAWAAKVRERCPKADVRLIEGTDEGSLRSERLFRDHGEHFFDSYVAAIDETADDSLDIVIVDGMCRIACVRRAAPKVKAGGLLVLDDTDRDFVSSEVPHIEEVRGWEVIRKSGFKRRDPDLAETTFFRRGT
jgi:predicted O-methyltransferase YrrM